MMMGKKKPALDIGLIFGSPKKGDDADDGDEGDDVIRTALGGGDMATRIAAFREAVKMCMGSDESESEGESDSEDY